MATNAASAAGKVAVELERLSAAAVHAINQRDFALNKTAEAKEVLQHVAPDFSGTSDGILGNVTLAELIEERRQFFLEHPQAYCDLKAMSTTIDPDGRTASVHLYVDIAGMETVTIPGMSEFRWRWTDGRWLWFHHIGMRGVELS